MKKKLVILSILAFSSALLFTGCKKTEEIKSIQEGDTVTIIYDSYLLDGEIIEESITKKITIGENDSFPIFDTELIGLKSGDTKEFTTNTPKEGYGIYYDDLKIQKISTNILDAIGAEAKVGEHINLGSQHFNGIITDVSPVNVTIDFNDKKTRENTEFHVTVLNIERNITEN